MPFYAMPFEMLRNGIYWNISVYWVIIGVYLAFDYQDHLKDRRLRNAELERLLSESRLQTLRAQLHPHFLFNTLNAISAHVERDPRVARRMIEQLGELLRLSLDHAEDPEIPLERELAFLDRYLELQKVRFEDRLDTVMNVDPGVLDALVPAFILQPLVENSIVHGVAASLRPSVISLDAWREGGRLRLRVQDDGPGLPAGWRTGLGISNTRERLHRLYGDDGQSFDISGPAGAGVRVDIAIPFRPSSNGTDAPGSTSNESASSTHRR
jgi:LytS/YehU family sensor histidine kinase